MITEQNLQWTGRMDEFSPDQQKILQALSVETYQWRAKDRLLQATGLNSDALDTSLTELIRRGIVKPAFSQKKDIVFGLRERTENH